MGRTRIGLSSFRFFLMVRVEGLEPPCLAASDPKSDTSTNFATPALRLKVCSLKPKVAVATLHLLPYAIHLYWGAKVRVSDYLKLNYTKFLCSLSLKESLKQKLPVAEIAPVRRLHG